MEKYHTNRCTLAFIIGHYGRIGIPSTFPPLLDLKLSK